MSSPGSIASRASRVSTATAQNRTRGMVGSDQDRAKPSPIKAAARQNGSSWAASNRSPWGRISSAPPISSRALAGSCRRRSREDSAINAALAAGRAAATAGPGW